MKLVLSFGLGVLVSLTIVTLTDSPSERRAEWVEADLLTHLEHHAGHDTRPWEYCRACWLAVAIKPAEVRHAR